MKKINYCLCFQILLILVLTFFAGYFLPINYIDNNLKIFEIFITIFGISLTLYTFIQGVVQNCKNNLILKDKEQEIGLGEKFSKLDGIVDELKSDTLVILITTLFFGGLSLFFGGIENNIWLHIFNYIRYLSIFIIVFLIIDLTLTMFKLVQINAMLNKLTIKKK